MQKFLLTFLLSLFLTSAYSQSDSGATKFKAFPLPIAYFTPETDWGFGVVSLFSFRFKNETKESRISQFQFGAAYTLRDQLLLYLPFQLYLKDENYYAFGELGYYKYSYRFFGVGSDLPKSDEELYAVDFPRIRLNVMKLARPNWYVGLRYWFDGYDITEVEENGILDRNRALGAEGGIISSLGIISLVDSRNDYNYPTKGTYFEFVVLPNLKVFGSDFEFTRISADYVKYLTKNKHTFALNLFSVANLGKTPFNEMALIGGTRRMRGYFEGRYRDNNMIMAQAEYRKSLPFNFGFVLFTGFGSVASTFNSFEIENIKPTVGGGLRYRLSKDEKINVRLDYGIGVQGSSGFYLTIGEAF